MTTRLAVSRPGRRSSYGLKTHCVNGHEFTDDNTYWRPDGKGRVCIECRNDRAAAKRERSR